MITILKLKKKNYENYKRLYYVRKYNHETLKK